MLLTMKLCRVIARNSVGNSEPFLIDETFTAAKADIPKSKTWKKVFLWSNQ